MTASTIKGAYADARQDGCSEEGCSVTLGETFVSYCGESLRNKIMDNQTPTKKMCDCIITNFEEDKISLVELKYREGSKKAFKGQRKAGRVEDVRGQFEGGLAILCAMLERIKKTNACVQFVLYTKTKIDHYAEQKKLRKPLSSATPNLMITTAVCGDQLPNNYIPVSVQEMCE